METINFRALGILVLGLALALLSGWLVVFAPIWAAVIPAMVFAVIIFMYPFLGLLLFTMLIPLELAFLSLGGNTATVTRYLGILVFGAWVVQEMFKRRRIKVTQDFVILIAFFLWGSLSVLWAFNQSVAFARFQTTLQLVLLTFLVINQVNDRKRLKQILIALFIGCLLVTLLGLLGVGTKSGGYLLTLQDVGAKEYGSYVGIMFLVGTILAVFEKGVNRVFGLVSALISLVVLVMVGERGVFLAIGMALVVIAIIFHQKLKLLIAIAVLSVLLIYLPAILEKQNLTNSVNVNRLTIQNIIETGGIRSNRYMESWAENFCRSCSNRNWMGQFPGGDGCLSGIYNSGHPRLGPS